MRFDIGLTTANRAGPSPLIGEVSPLGRSKSEAQARYDTKIVRINP